MLDDIHSYLGGISVISQQGQIHYFVNKILLAHSWAHLFIFCNLDSPIATAGSRSFVAYRDKYISYLALLEKFMALWAETQGWSGGQWIQSVSTQSTYGWFRETDWQVPESPQQEINASVSHWKPRHLCFFTSFRKAFASALFRVCFTWRIVWSLGCKAVHEWEAGQG